MLITEEITLSNFNTWAGANKTKDELTYSELDELEEYISELYPDGLSQTQLNDILWFEQDWIAECLGFEDWDDLVSKQDERYSAVYGER